MPGILLHPTLYTKMAKLLKLYPPLLLFDKLPNHTPFYFDKITEFIPPFFFFW